MQPGDEAWMTLEASGWRTRALKAEAELMRLRQPNEATPAPVDVREDDDWRGSFKKFDGVGDHSETMETRARIGERFLECYESALSDPLLKGYHPADCPSEVVLDLLERLRHPQPSTPVADAELAGIITCMDQMLADPALDALAFDKHDATIIRRNLAVTPVADAGMVRDAAFYAANDDGYNPATMFAAPRPWTLEDRSGDAHPTISIESSGRSSAVAFKYAPAPSEVRDFELIVAAVNDYAIAAAPDAEGGR